MTQIASNELLSSALTAVGAVAEVLVPGDDGYAGSAATLFADGTPDLVVRPHDAAGVVAALRYAARTGLAVTVRSGGHSMAGLSASADGMIIDTRRISGVRLLDPASGRVRVGAGATWGAVAAALHPHGLGLTAGDTSGVGVAGLTLGGGIGWMVRRHGLAIDSLAAVQLVTADGRLIGADAVEHADLFWALRGGGGNFGVAVGFDFTAQPVTSVHFGEISYQAGDVPRLIAGWRDLMRASDEKLTTTLTLMPAMAGRPGTATLTCCYASPDGGEAAQALAPFRALAPVTSDSIRAMPYAGILEDAAPLPPGLRMEVRNAFFAALDDARVAAAGELFAGGGAALMLRSMGGAAARVSRDATAFAHRDAEVMVAAAFLLPQPAPSGMLPEALKRWSPVAALGSGAYVGFLGSAAPADVAAAYPPATYRRLAAVKRRYDPANVFRRTHNILPAQGRLLAGVMWRPLVEERGDLLVVVPGERGHDLSPVLQVDSPMRTNAALNVAEGRDLLLEVHPRLGRDVGCPRPVRGRLLQVQAGAETPAGPGDHDHPARLVGGRVVEGPVQVADQLPGHGVQPLRPVQGDDPHPRCGLLDPDGPARSRICRRAIGRHQSWIAAVRRSDMPSSVCLPPIRPQPVRRPPAPPNGMLMSHQQVLSFTTTWPTSSSSTNR